MNGKAANGEENGISEEHTEELIEEVKGKKQQCTLTIEYSV